MGELWAATAVALPSIDQAAWIPVWLALIGAVQLIWVEIIRRKVGKVETKVVEQKDATTKLEAQINSNLEKQFDAFKNEVLAKERLYVAEKTDTQDKLVAKAEKAAKAEGKEEERAKTAKEEKKKE